jgi:hypothetical protein
MNTERNNRMSTVNYEDVGKAMIDAWMRECRENSWPFEAEIADDVSTFVIDIVIAYMINKYAGGYDVLELAVQDAFTSREERLGEESWFSEIARAAGETWDREMRQEDL